MSEWAIWGALILTSLAGIAALALLVKRALAAWQDVKDARRDVVRRLDDLAAKGEATAEKVGSVGDTAGLEESLGRLRISLAQLAVLRNALDEAEDTFARVTAFVPHK